jgi:ADP-ribosylglycohydrolase
LERSRGDIIGSPYEHRNHTGTDFVLFSSRSRFTDDTVLTVAVADALLHAKDYEDAVRKAVSLGGDSDTIACIAGEVAHAFFGPLPPEIEQAGLVRIVREFSGRYLPVS